MKKEKKEKKENIKEAYLELAKEEKAEKAPEPLKLFLAVYPDEKGGLPDYWDDFLDEKSLLLLHPMYDYENAEVVPNLLKSGIILPPLLTIKRESDLPYLTIRRDLFGLSSCDVLIYDSDKEAGHHFIAWALQLNKRVIVISESLKSVPMYFSGAVESVLRPQDVVRYLNTHP